MKMIINVIIVMAIILVSCDMLRSKSNMQDSIPGTYVAKWNSEYSDTHDTLQILAHTQGSAAQYEIIRRTFHRYIDRHKPAPPTYKIEHWTGSYTPSEQRLLIHKNGRVLSFDPAKGQLKMGITIYQKLSPNQ
ncbi:MAG: hypothetical protein DI535_03540 [Citrobacter freundii]|nr:MAG: hypothetical protein DI535_03540 [Citrobacter freundii]